MKSLKNLITPRKLSHIFDTSDESRNNSPLKSPLSTPLNVQKKKYPKVELLNLKRNPTYLFILHAVRLATLYLSVIFFIFLVKYVYHFYDRDLKRCPEGYKNMNGYCVSEEGYKKLSGSVRSLCNRDFNSTEGVRDDIKYCENVFLLKDKVYFCLPARRQLIYFFWFTFVSLVTSVLAGKHLNKYSDGY